MHILIVDRVKLFYEIITDLLKDSGIKVSWAENGINAKQLLGEDKFDFIASALHLDDTDGITLCRNIRADSTYTHTPFVLLTTESSPGIQEKAISSGVTDIFAKTNINEFSTFIGRIGQKNRPISGRILYVEDSKSQRDLVTTMFVSRGLEVDGFASGETAWEAFQANEYDLVVTDIVLEGDISGVMLANHIRRLEVSKGDTPILAITGYDNVARRIGLLHLGVNDYVAKPVVEEELFVRVTNLLALGNHLKTVKFDLAKADADVVDEQRKRTDAENERQLLIESHKALLAITRSSIMNLNINDYLGVIFGILVTVDWLDSVMKGGIHLRNLKGELVLAAKYGLTDHDKESYVQVVDSNKGTFDLKQTNVMFVDASPEASVRHGFYLLPLNGAEGTIGVMQVAVTPKHQTNQATYKFMIALSEIMSNFICRRMTDETLRINQCELESARDELIQKLGHISEFRDSDTGMHIIRMSKYAAILAKHSGADDQFCEQLEKAAPMHDVGKIAISDEILKKPGRLTGDEFEIMKTHAISGAAILEGKGKLLAIAREIALSHHEKWDGGGYPSGLSGEDIPLTGRICAIVDVFDALTMERPYKKAWTTEDAKQLIIDSSGTHFDPKLVEAFLQSFSEILQLKALYSEETIDPKAILPHSVASNKDNELVSWSEEYSVGMDIIDAHHQYLFNAINNLHDAITNNQGAGRISKTLRMLDEYTYIHFREEEKMMRDMGYPYMEEHIKLHALFEKRIKEFQQELRYNPLTSSTSVVEFLKDWLVSHICKIDGQIINESNAA